jgi:hypothetical protein
VGQIEESEWRETEGSGKRLVKKEINLSIYEEIDIF